MGWVKVFLSAGAASLSAITLWRVTGRSNPAEEQPSLSSTLNGASCAEPSAPNLPTVPSHVIRTGNHGTVSSPARLEAAVSKCRGLVRRVMLEQGVPGAVVAVVRDGELVWSEGLGLADVENNTPCTPDTVMRIASISKPLTAVGLLQLYQQHKVELDVPVQTYLPDFPRKTFEGQEVDITVRQLLSHLGGIRHYSKQSKGKANNSDGKKKEGEGKTKEVEGQKKESEQEDFEQKEFYIMKHYDSVKDSVKLFADDDLVRKPGSEFYYTTHGWTLISAVMESVSGQKFLRYMKRNVLDPLGMSKTMPELKEKLIYGRSRHYVRKDGILRNTPYVDLSYKWAGGGYISTAEDLVKFGNAVLTCWQLGQSSDHTTPPERCLLTPPTTNLMLTPAVEKANTNSDKPSGPAPPAGYGMGWSVRQQRAGLVAGRSYPLVFSHSGGAVGASSVLIVLPRDLAHEGSRKVCVSSVCADSQVEGSSGSHPYSQGVVVAVIFNLQKVMGVPQLGMKIAEEFSDL